MADCLACQVANGDRDLPGGLIYGTPFWRIEHPIGPLGLGTRIAKPVRPVTSEGARLGGEAIELGWRTHAHPRRRVVEADGEVQGREPCPRRKVGAVRRLPEGFGVVAEWDRS